MYATAVTGVQHGYKYRRTTGTDTGEQLTFYEMHHKYDMIEVCSH